MTTTEPTVCDLETRRQAVRDAWDRLDEAIARDRAREQALKSEREKDEEGGMSKHYTTDDSRSAAAELDTAREAAMVLLRAIATQQTDTVAKPNWGHVGSARALVQTLMHAYAGGANLDSGETFELLNGAARRMSFTLEDY